MVFLLREGGVCLSVRRGRREQRRARHGLSDTAEARMTRREGASQPTMASRPNRLSDGNRREAARCKDYESRRRHVQQSQMSGRRTFRAVIVDPSSGLRPSLTLQVIDSLLQDDEQGDELLKRMHPECAASQRPDERAQANNEDCIEGGRSVVMEP